MSYRTDYKLGRQPKSSQHNREKAKTIIEGTSKAEQAKEVKNKLLFAAAVNAGRTNRREPDGSWWLTQAE